MNVFIYSLHDPETGHLRYVGKAENLESRLKSHLWDAIRGRSHRDNWILSLRERGLKPLQFSIAEVEESDWQLWERYYIRQAKILGFNLINGTEGGEGGRQTDEVRAKMSRACLGRKHSAETRKKMSLSRKGKKHSAEWCSNISAGRTGVVVSIEGRKRMSEAGKLRVARQRGLCE